MRGVMSSSQALFVMLKIVDQCLLLGGEEAWQECERLGIDETLVCIAGEEAILPDVRAHAAQIREDHFDRNEY